MRFENTVIPLRAAWSSPFVRWQGATADLNSLELAKQVTGRALRERGTTWPVRELVLGWTIPQKEAFYGAPTLAAQLGFPGVSGPMISQACATSVAALHAAAATQDVEPMGARLVVTTDRTSNGPHLTYPRTSAPGGTPDSENWVLDSFARDPMTGESMLATAERVAVEGGMDKSHLDELTVRRYEQYADALADDRAFQRRWMVPITVGRGKRATEIEEDQGIRPAVLEELGALAPVTPDGVVSYGSQTHPADGAAGMILTTAQQARDLGVDGPLARIRSTGFARVDAGTMPKAPVPAARAALHDAGLTFDDVDIVKTHNPFVVNDVWFARETGVDARALNPYGCSLIYGHPQGPTGARGIVELLHALEDRGGGIGLFTGCAAGDTGAAVVVEVTG
ncbi:thiolase family protein [Capillimicrobium parvum]|uniref:Probable acetyl-CoA acetyltransferase n=1 Tax=Capillimicrobium parvum TaxID=2884022 RepID=A0A9E6XXB7_9ACTN|nr:thiolase family protein [Capillimicrobium parvum]UGS36139.1 Acetyl-CoA acetyltransferase [Capillimicrobium parvum]